MEENAAAAGVDAAVFMGGRRPECGLAHRPAGRAFGRPLRPRAVLCEKMRPREEWRRVESAAAPLAAGHLRATSAKRRGFLTRSSSGLLTANGSTSSSRKCSPTTMGSGSCRWAWAVAPSSMSWSPWAQRAAYWSARMRQLMRSRKDLWRDHLLMFLVKWGIGYTTFLKLSHCLVKMPTLNRM